FLRFPANMIRANESRICKTSMSKTQISPANEESNYLQPKSNLNASLFTTTGQLRKQLRRNRHSWSFFRFALGIFGAALVILPIALPQSWIAAIFGLGFFLTAILLPSALDGPAARKNSRESQAQIVLKGAEFFDGSGLPQPVQLFVSHEQILAMKQDL